MADTSRDAPAPSPRPVRACLFVPADRPRAVAKAAGLGADALMLDLEDAVAPEARAAAREGLGEAIALWADVGARRVIRINAPGTEDFGPDADAAAAARPDAVLIAKIDGLEALRAARARLEAAGHDGPIWAMIETPKAVLRLETIADSAASMGLQALVAGANDLALALRCRADDRSVLAPHLARVVLAARAAGIAALDGVWNDFSDAEGFRRDAAAARAQGFDGKTLIHPSQVSPAIEAWRPDAAELERARAVRDAFADPENAGKGAVNVDGRMAERLHLVAARDALARAGEDPGPG